MYKLLIKPLLFLFPPEQAHHLVFSMLKMAFKIPGVKTFIKSLYSTGKQGTQVAIGNLKFNSRVGLAAGFDKDAYCFDELAAFGFGFIEIGTVTPRPQPGNPKPRLFRLPADEALINRMGFNNEGVDAVVERLKNRKSDVIIGGNIGKNKDTANEDALSDYLICFEKLFDVVDYFVINVSSPNTPGLRALQEKEPLTKLLNGIQQKNKSYRNPKPVFLKIAPDLTYEQIDEVAVLVEETNLNGLIVSNTTISRENLKADADEVKNLGAGGLSGKPLQSRSTEIIRYLTQSKKVKFDIIGVGGIHSASDAIEKIEAGAKLVQLFTGFIYEGPGLVKKINRAMIKK
ncbi:MAG TPA: quinone-dependent dihydroorotate dehydrogenase [Bacteroidia bacterium]|nr:quinone-dependent dihydroorotate dehydrogenase [Bacteroidia bacterium]MBP7715182.1 quinone-dependent dihydroorotate dehydrogenase [Bacteroidia bacterium]MBP8668526.1 quinone-dependent dihydroorotate dehydrogenase [Bacteroidia bacterium]HOZ83034.1 quinone-dependent dihydroorotate dehydrogenase [Bacteroidia bacterium]HQW17999.1 quinone-dependent dihydroorotate dehydrogenase [Bacteroidia bacterium]